MKARQLDWEGCHNVRDLGGLHTPQGHQTRWGVVVRADDPSNLTPAGWDALYAYGIRTIISLRTAGMQEDELVVVNRPADLVTVDVAIEDLSDTEFAQKWASSDLWCTPLYYQDALNRWPQRHAAVVAAIAHAQDGGVLFHCRRGNDRTGIITLLLLALVGVGPDEIADDYQLSPDPDRERLLQEQHTSTREVILNTLASLDVQTYLLDAGLSQADLDTVKDRLLEPIGRSNSMLINCYYYAPHNHTLLSEHLKTDLARMAELGTDVVSVCVQESQLTNWHQQRLRNVVDQVHAHGMKAHAVPNRWAGLFAGWLDGFGRFTLENRDTLICGPDGTPKAVDEMVSCINQPKVEQHITSSLTQLFDLFDFDGLIWDEPHAEVCHCAYCRALTPSPTDEWYYTQFAQFLDQASHYAKSLRPDAVISVFVQPHQRGLLQALSETTEIDYLGSDGHIRSPDHQMHRMKGTIFEAYDEFYPLIADAGKKTFFLLEAQRHRDADLENFLLNIERAFDLKIDHLMYYYSAHEMSPQNEVKFNKAMWSNVRRVHEKRIHQGS